MSESLERQVNDMKIAIVGTGYVGLVTGICFASKGHKVVCIDNNEEKINALNNNIIPIYEPGLKELVELYRENLIFTTNKNIIDKCDLVFICVGTPMGEDGSADLQYVLAVAKDIGNIITNNITIVDKSTVPVGTANKVNDIIARQLKKRGVNTSFQVVSNPEFLKEGSAINDFLNPDRVVIGCDHDPSIMLKLYNFVQNDKIVVMDIKSAELTKYASNAMLATKISFINEISNICEKVGADVNKVRHGMGMDKRIGFSFISPGCGYGGSCFPKDVQALIKTSKDNSYEPQILNAVESVNKQQKKVLGKKIIHRFGEDLSHHKFAVWGLAFKPNTDDMREAPSIPLIKELLNRGADVAAYDPEASKTAKYYIHSLHCCDDKYDTLFNADALILVTEWKEFINVDFDKVKSLLKSSIIFDGRNLYQDVIPDDFEYYQIGVKTK